MQWLNNGGLMTDKLDKLKTNVKQMADNLEAASHCPTCGASVRIVGNTTKHYEPIADEKLRIAVEYLNKMLPVNIGGRKYVSLNSQQVMATEALEKIKEKEAE